MIERLFFLFIYNRVALEFCTERFFLMVEYWLLPKMCNHFKERTKGKSAELIFFFYAFWHWRNSADMHHWVLGLMTKLWEIKSIKALTAKRSLPSKPNQLLRVFRCLQTVIRGDFLFSIKTGGDSEIKFKFSFLFCLKHRLMLFMLTHELMATIFVLF